MIHKIFFLFKCNSTFKIYFYFLKSKLFNIFFKRKIISLKRKHELLIKNKKITTNYFSPHSFNFYQYLYKLNRNFNYLEIGSYEGNSAMFVADNFKESSVYCVDTWVKTNEYTDHISFSHIEDNFDFNTKEYKNIYKSKNTSDNFFIKNKVMYDVIYIDGYHLGAQVYKDCKNSWKFLKKEGFLICDDYIWDFYDSIEDNPCYFINKFLKENKGYYKIQKISNSQIFIKKINH